jgi:hypothetical protein
MFISMEEIVLELISHFRLSIVVGHCNFLADGAHIAQFEAI